MCDTTMFCVDVFYYRFIISKFEEVCKLESDPIDIYESNHIMKCVLLQVV